MNPIKREFILYLEDMFQSMQRIEEYLGNLDFKKFKMTHIVVDAVVRKINGVSHYSHFYSTCLFKIFSNINKIHLTY